MTPQQILQHYGLDQNPFPDGALKEESIHLFVMVDGFRDSFARLESWFAANSQAIGKRVAHGRNTLVDTPFVLVYGPEGSGCTSVANYILRVFCCGSEFANSTWKAEPFFVEMRDSASHIPIQSVLALMMSFAGQMGINRGEYDRLKGLCEQYIYTMDEMPPSTYFLAFKGLTDFLFTECRIPIVVIEKVHYDTKNQLFLFQDAFKNNGVVLLTTTDQAVYDCFRRMEVNHFVIELRELSVEDVNDLIKHRLAPFSAPRRISFDPDKVTTVFKDRMSFKSVIKILNRAFDLKVAQLQDIDQLPESMWISDELAEAARHLYAWGKI